MDVLVGFSGGVQTCIIVSCHHDALRRCHRKVLNRYILRWIPRDPLQVRYRRVVRIQISAHDPLAFLDLNAILFLIHEVLF